jgi:hypothetical protein
MTVKVAAPDYQLQIVDSQLRQLREFNDWVNEVNLSIPLLGEGDPEGIVDAIQGQIFIDTTGASGSILYVKKLAAIGGDDTQGWIAA